jgi:sigma-B regulation protein RsbU (phosphoserine phosphatase)
VKILIAEDEFTTRMMVQVCLENWGYRVETATNGSEAMRLMEKDDAPQIAILDWEMPELAGIEVCSKVKDRIVENPPYVILLTGRDSNTDILRGFDAGADDYMTKPFNDDELRARVRVAERLVRTQFSLAETVAELKDALNQLELLEGRVEICPDCRSVFSMYDGVWHSLQEILKYGADPRFVNRRCPQCTILK